MGHEESQLIARCKHGDTDAYGELMRWHRDSVYRVAYAIIGDHDQAEDVVQEAFMRAYEAMGRFDRKQRFAPWIERIAANYAISLKRQGGGRPQVSESGVVQYAEGNPSESIAAQQLHSTIRQAITTLPRQQRLAISLFYLKDMDLLQTAEVLGCAVGTVKRYLHRARQKLEKMLTDYLEEDDKSEV